jgi:hypothetical protein
MACDFSGLNRACLYVFGQAFTFTPAATGAPQPITGILDSGVEPESRAPGDGSVYARLWLEATVDPVPTEGDEIASDTTVYKIVRTEQDTAAGLWLLLRKDRDL